MAKKMPKNIQAAEPPKKKSGGGGGAKSTRRKKKRTVGREPNRCANQKCRAKLKGGHVVVRDKKDGSKTWTYCLKCGSQQ